MVCPVIVFQELQGSRTAAIMGSDPQFIKHPNLSLAQDIFTLTNSYSTEPARQGSFRKLRDAIKENHMAPLYRYLAHPTDGILNAPGQGSARRPSGSASKRPNVAAGIVPGRRRSTDFVFPWDQGQYDSMEGENAKKLEEFEKEEEEALASAGDTDVQAVRGRRAEYRAMIGDRVRSLAEGGCTIRLTQTGVGNSVIRSSPGRRRPDWRKDRSCPRYDPHPHVFQRSPRGKDQY